MCEANLEMHKERCEAGVKPRQNYDEARNNECEAGVKLEMHCAMCKGKLENA